MPEEQFAAQVLELGVDGRLLVFPGHEVEYTARDDPYYDSHVLLAEGGLHRNVFRVDRTGRPIWRIADYDQPLSDEFTEVRPSEESDKAFGVTFRGWIMRIDLTDGTLEVIDRTE